MQSLPLYEGVDWNTIVLETESGTQSVSLFTREWIEISCRRTKFVGQCVSLFTREWIEIFSEQHCLARFCCLPLYEGVDWNKIHKLRILFLCIVSLFTREWIEILKSLTSMLAVSPVSLFTREWIEINITGDLSDLGGSLPLYEGVDWNAIQRVIKIIGKRLPLYEGVDWNHLLFQHRLSFR